MSRYIDAEQIPYYPAVGDGFAIEGALVSYKTMIDKIPTADVSPVVHGHWSKRMRCIEDFMKNRTYGYKCSVCGGIANGLPFCGNCGAIMDESEGSK